MNTTSNSPSSSSPSHPLSPPIDTLKVVEIAISLYTREPLAEGRLQAARLGFDDLALDSLDVAALSLYLFDLLDIPEAVQPQVVVSSLAAYVQFFERHRRRDTVDPQEMRGHFV